MIVYIQEVLSEAFASSLHLYLFIITIIISGSGGPPSNDDTQSLIIGEETPARANWPFGTYLSSKLVGGLPVGIEYIARPYHIVCIIIA